MIGQTIGTMMILTGLYLFGLWHGWKAGLEIGGLREKRRADREKEWKE
jgi:hypothetical protein